MYVEYAVVEQFYNFFRKWVNASSLSDLQKDEVIAHLGLAQNDIYRCTEKLDYFIKLEIRKGSRKNESFLKTEEAIAILQAVVGLLENIDKKIETLDKKGDENA